MQESSDSCFFPDVRGSRKAPRFAMPVFILPAVDCKSMIRQTVERKNYTLVFPLGRTGIFVAVSLLTFDIFRIVCGFAPGYPESAARD